MSAKFDGFPSLPFQDIKEKPKRHGGTDTRTERRTEGWTDGWTNGQRENSIPPPTNIVCGGYKTVTHSPEDHLCHLLLS